MKNYVVISSYTHAGADLLDYRPYLESKYHDAFDDFDLAELQPLADEFDPSVEKVAAGLYAIPTGAQSFAFREQVTVTL